MCAWLSASLPVLLGTSKRCVDLRHILHSLSVCVLVLLPGPHLWRCAFALSHEKRVQLRLMHPPLNGTPIGVCPCSLPVGPHMRSVVLPLHHCPWLLLMHMLRKVYEGTMMCLLYFRQPNHGVCVYHSHMPSRPSSLSTTYP